MKQLVDQGEAYRGEGPPAGRGLGGSGSWLLTILLTLWHKEQGHGQDGKLRVH